MKSYDSKGLYNRYDRNHCERDSLDYYSTPTEEVTNILNEMKIDFSNQTILEPCCGGGHMYKGILDYFSSGNYADAVIATDVQERVSEIEFPHEAGEQYDFLSDNYEVPNNIPIDYIIMNPPYATIEPFTIRALEIARKGVLLLGRLQFLEGQGRYDTILKDTPPTDIWVYVDRIKCYKGGDTTISGSSAQAYAWFYFDTEKIKNKEEYDTKVHWIRKFDKNKKNDIIK